MKVTLKLEDTLPAFYVGLHTPHHDKRSCPHGNFFLTYPIQYQPDYISDSPYISAISPLISAIFHYIDRSTQAIDLPAIFGNLFMLYTLPLQ
ncbi:hypothetical protein LQK80_03260 [Bacillus thuringiensis]|nr:hypothetical protein [Bacillus thuringiensis]